jgi:hypothetical protein
MNRAALLQCPGDPFLTAYWLRNYERVWNHTVDQLDVFVNGCIHQPTVEWIKAEVERLGGRFTYQPGRLVHGQATRVLVENSAADVVMLIEDDAFVRDSQAVDAAFWALETGITDVVATPRGGMDPEIERYSIEKWGNFSKEGGGSGTGLWPCFFWAHRDTLMETSRRFESWAWNPGEVIPGLEYEVKDRVQTTDTMTAVAFELRGKGLRIKECVQYKELWDRVAPCPPDAPWFHAGGLSNCDPLDNAFYGARPGLGGNNEGLDWAHRLWWMRRCVDTAGRIQHELQDGYRANIEAAVDAMGIRAEYEDWTPKCLEWITWDDQA